MDAFRSEPGFRCVLVRRRGKSSVFGVSIKS